MAKIDDLLDANAKKIQSGIKKEFDTLVEKLQKEGMSYNDAKVEAKKRLKAVYRHTLDTIAVGMKKALKEDITPRYVEEMEVEGVKLSKRLYSNLRDVEAMTLKTIKQAIKDKKSVKEAARLLYDGYNFKDDPLKVKKALPKYLMEDINKMSDARIRKIKTPSLKAAYYEALKAKSDEELYKKLKNAFYERNRYYANRIAQTEIFKAYSKKEAQRFMDDDSLEVVKVRLSRTHPVTDICDYHTGVDKFGLGKGVYPKEKAPLPPFHPFCRCKMLPSYVHKAKNAKERKEADREFMSGLSEHQKARVLGSKLKVQRFERDGNVLKHSYYPNPLRVGDVGYNSWMEKYKEIENNFLSGIDSFKTETKHSAIDTFPLLWMSIKDYERHMTKRLYKEKVVTDEWDYIQKTFDALLSSDVYYEAYEDPQLWDRVFYSKENNWAVVVAQNGKILTSYKIKSKIEDTLKKHEEFLKAKISKVGVGDDFKRTIREIVDKLGKL